jgi:hypothetical protein
LLLGDELSDGLSSSWYTNEEILTVLGICPLAQWATGLPILVLLDRQNDIIFQKRNRLVQAMEIPDGDFNATDVDDVVDDRSSPVISSEHEAAFYRHHGSRYERPEDLCKVMMEYLVTVGVFPPLPVIFFPGDPIDRLVQSLNLDLNELNTALKTTMVRKTQFAHYSRQTIELLIQKVGEYREALERTPKQEWAERKDNLSRKVTGVIPLNFEYPETLLHLDEGDSSAATNDQTEFLKEKLKEIMEQKVVATHGWREDKFRHYFCSDHYRDRVVGVFDDVCPIVYKLFSDGELLGMVQKSIPQMLSEGAKTIPDITGDAHTWYLSNKDRLTNYMICSTIQAIECPRLVELAESLSGVRPVKRNWRKLAKFSLNAQL